MKFPSLAIDEIALREACNYPSACKHSDKRLRRREDINGRPWLFNQCQDCGQKVGGRVSAKGMTNKEVNDLIKFDEEFSRDVWVSYHKRYTEAREIERARIKENWRKCYDIYIVSTEWRIKRLLVLNRAKHICEGCGTATAEEVHHTTYENVGEEFLFELVALCKPCHDRFHSKILPRFLEDLFVRGFSGPSVDIEVPVV
ncbi:MAG: hypothetical protein WC661_08770 [Opitutaceae bacterium]|jgi:5-methylcytosine-specific restriction endonuclease McrA